MRKRDITDEALIEDALEGKPDRYTKLRSLAEEMTRQTQALAISTKEYQTVNDSVEASQEQRGIRRVKIFKRTSAGLDPRATIKQFDE